MARHPSDFASSLLVEDLAARYYVPPPYEDEPASMRSPIRSGIHRRAVAHLRDLLGRKTRHYRASPTRPLCVEGRRGVAHDHRFKFARFRCVRRA